jgi:hypothetical protein
MHGLRGLPFDVVDAGTVAVGEGPRRVARFGVRRLLAWVQRSGAYSGHDMRTHMLAAAVGITRTSWDYHLDVKAFYESGADPAGTATRWEYLAPVMDGLRWRVLQDRPRLITPTARERRVLMLQRAAADAEQPPQRTPLARL